MLVNNKDVNSVFDNIKHQLINIRISRFIHLCSSYLNVWCCRCMFVRFWSCARDKLEHQTSVCVFIKHSTAAISPIVINILRPIRLSIIAALSMMLPSLTAWSESEDMSVNIPVSPTTEKTQLLPKGYKLNLIHYNREEYLLAYNVFVMNGRVELAYEVASAAVKERPNDIFWRKKLIQSALWSGYSEVALEQWMYFINNNINPDLYITNALKLAKQLNNYDVQARIFHYQLVKAPKDKQLILQYSIALQNQGYPIDALKFLQQIPNVNNDPEYLKQLAAIAKGLDSPNLQLHYLERLERVDKQDIEPVLEHAELLYSRGDIIGAYRIYHSLENSPHVNAAYWSSYGNISLLVGENASTIIAFRHLMQQGALDNSSLLLMINLEESAGQKEAAYNDAIIAYQRHKSSSLVRLILSLGEELHKWRDMQSFLAKLPRHEIEKLKSKPQYAILLINLKEELGFTAEARRAWVWVFQRWPNLTIVQQAYLWFLIDTNDIKQLEYTLSRWRRLLYRKPKLWTVYFAALNSIGDYPQALKVMLQHQDKINKSYALLTNLADLFVQNNKSYAAYYASKKALYLLIRKINKQTGHLSMEQQLTLIELLNLFGPASLTYELVFNLNKQLFTDLRIDNQVIDWALKNESYALASYIADIDMFYGRTIPSWMTLTLALVYNDRDSMADMLFHYPKLLPHRDRVVAAVRTGNLKLAEEYAYVGLKEHPIDYEMYQLFEETMLPRSNRFSIGTGQYTNANIGGPFTRTSLRLFVTPSISVTPYGTVWFPHIDNFTQVAFTPKIDEISGLTVRKYIDKGWLEANFGQRVSFENMIIAKLKWQYRISSAVDSRLSLKYHEMAPETDTLLVAGMKNEASLLFRTIWDKYNMSETQIRMDQFLGQDNTFLGTGEELEFHWQNKFYLEYPDWNINFYGTWASYQDSSRPLSKKLQRFLPPNIVEGTSFFMPDSYTEGAVTLGFGQQYRYDYTHAWKAFAEAGVLYTKPFGFGQIAQGGIAGSVFGRDHLTLYAEYSFNQQQASQKYYTIGIRYDNYF